jgi:beta-barrel assembly-enhancing protease
MNHLIRITLAGALLGAAALPFSHADLADLPSMGDTAGQLISPEQEKQFGESFMRQIRRSGKLVQDPELNDYLQQLGYRLAAASDAPGYGFTFFLVDDPSINAFAGPGGYIGVHTGLLLAARNESELAGVLAHEIAHVTQRHLLRAYEAAQRMSLPTAAALLAAILIGSQDSQAGQAALVGLQAASAQYQINFTRANEHEADRVGIQTLVRSGIDPRGMPDFFERLHQQTRLYGNRLPEFLSTHPVTTSRIAETAARAEAHAGEGRRDSLGFQLARTSLQVESSPSCVIWWRITKRAPRASARRSASAMPWPCGAAATTRVHAGTDPPAATEPGSFALPAQSRPAGTGAEPARPGPGPVRGVAGTQSRQRHRHPRLCRRPALPRRVLPGAEAC